ncbi:protein NRT1/ PTR FAMILY 4.6 [Helianthus annuus]|uniref:Putative proton-dependent oligopeptide transporter family n=1 Tax=Helianthus annuus TaxID=4232 RepID=A0A251VC39_HELAN|nr:protein NRT1/ PTR FAMILY 4.6 [Helianthus annuus]
MKELEHELDGWKGYVDYRFRPAQKGRHGGMRAALFVLGVEVLENLAFLANASNLVLYLSKYMNLPISKSANNVTNFMGTAFLLALLGGFLSDAYFTGYYIYLMSAGIEFLGLIILTFQARSPYLKPEPCNKLKTTICEEIHGGKAAMLFIGLYLVAFGIGGIKGSLPTLGAEQFDEDDPKGRKQRSTFFNYFVFCLSFGGLIAVTLVLWIEDNVGWQWGFGIATISIFLSIIIFSSGSCFYRCKVPKGSPLTTMFKVILGAILNVSKTESKQSHNIANPTQSPYPLLPTYTIEQQRENNNGPETPNPSQSRGFLNRAIEAKPAFKSLKCSVQDVEDVKIMLQILPIFACTIILNCCLAQLSTFSVQQAATMNTNIGPFKVPPASLPVFPIIFLMILAPLYDHVVIPFARKCTKSETGISHLQRIGLGLCFSTIAMAVAGLVEIKRKKVANKHGPGPGPLPITFLWIAFQYLFLGSADLFVLAGLMEFSFTQAPVKVRSLATSFSWASLAMGYYLSGVIVSFVNSVTGRGNGHHPWLSGENLNHFQLDKFYLLMFVLSVLNFCFYLFWANRYKYRLISGND